MTKIDKRYYDIFATHSLVVGVYGVVVGYSDTQCYRYVNVYKEEDRITGIIWFKDKLKQYNNALVRETINKIDELLMRLEIL